MESKMLYQRDFCDATKNNYFVPCYRKLSAKLKRNLPATVQLLSILNTEKYFNCKEINEPR